MNHKNEVLQPPAAVFVVRVKQEPEEDPSAIDPLAVMHDKKMDFFVKLQIKEEPTDEELDILAHNEQQLLGVDKSSDLTETGDANDDETQNDENNEVLQPPVAVFVVPVKQEPEEDSAAIDPLAVMHGEKTDCLVELQIKEEPTSKELDIQEFSNRMCDQNTEKVHTQEKRTCVYPDSKRSFFGKLLSAPLKLHIRGKLWYCNKCNLYFTTKEDLVKHKLLISEQKPFHCVSENSATMISNLNVYTQSDAVYLPFQCVKCEKSYSEKYLLNTHYRIIHPDYKPLHCNECKKSFFWKYQLNIHMQRHTDYKPFQCNECEKSFSQKGSLTRHMKTHTGYNPFQCGECEKSFSQKYSLNRHMQTHTGDKSF